MKINKLLIVVVIIVFLIIIILQFNKPKESLIDKEIFLSDISFNAFWIDSNSCNNLEENKATISITFSVNNKTINEPCKMYVDNQDAGGPLYEDIPKINDYFLGMFEANKDHKVKVCCKDICKDVNVPKLCSKEDSGKVEEIESYENSLNEICKNEPDTCGCPFTSNYKNDKVAIICNDCGEGERELLEKTLEYQTEVYTCLQKNFGYDLDQEAKPIRYSISFLNQPAENELNSAGSADYCHIYNKGFIGVIKPGNIKVSDVEDLRADVHETAHIFTNSLFNEIPLWFNEAISIYSESRIKCHPKQTEGFYGMRDSAKDRYNSLKAGDSSVQNVPHYMGEMFNLALETDYQCDVNCFFRIIKDLKESCNDSTNCNISNKEIKESSEKITGQDLTNTFNLLKLEY